MNSVKLGALVRDFECLHLDLKVESVLFGTPPVLDVSF